MQSICLKSLKHSSLQKFINLNIPNRAYLLSHNIQSLRTKSLNRPNPRKIFESLLSRKRVLFGLPILLAAVPKEEKKKEVRIIKILNPRSPPELKKSIEAADDLYEAYINGQTELLGQLYENLSNLRGTEEPEVLWRLARAIYEKSKGANGAEKKNLLEDGFSLMQTALARDEQNFAVHKWMAIFLNAVSGLKGTKEQITQLKNVRAHMERAIELNPKDPTAVYLLGNWCYSVAEVPWYQRKVAETIFATPPTCSYKEAADHFIKAENLEPLFYSMNLLMLAKSFLRIGNKVQAEEFLQILNNFNCGTQEDKDAKKEGDELLEKLRKEKKA